jgi:hypothetical protein
MRFRLFSGAEDLLPVRECPVRGLPKLIVIRWSRMSVRGNRIIYKRINMGKLYAEIKIMKNLSKGISKSGGCSYG